MQGIPSANLVLAEYLQNPLPRPRGVWTGPIRRDSWILDSCNCPAMRCRVGEAGCLSPDADRLRHTWHLHAPNVPFWEYYDQPELLKEDMWLQFNLQKAWRPLAGRKFAVIFDPEDRFVQYVRTMYDVQQQGRPGWRLILHGLLLTVLGEVFAAQRAGGAGTVQDPWQVYSHCEYAQGRENQLLARVDSAVMQKLSPPPSLEELAETLCMSVSSLAHRFKSETDLTVVQRIQWLRIREARRLLLDPEMGVKSVSRQLRFSSPAYFAKVFRKVTGMTPRIYRATRKGLGRTVEGGDGDLDV